MRSLIPVRSLMLGSTIIALAAAAAGTAGAGPATGPCSSGTVVKTPAYVFALSIGPVETMYTPAQVSAKHPKSGEVMLAGKMVEGMAGMTMSSDSQRHLEVHICTPVGKAVTGAHPVISVNGAMVPVAVMEGVGEGASDLHYGNNVELKAGQKVTVVVTLDGQKAVFHTAVPKSSAM